MPYYEHGGITIYHGDAREVLPGLAGDVVLTDPPYGVGFKYGAAYEDDETGYRAWITPIFALMREAAPLVLLTPGICNVGIYPPPTWMLCWAKPGSTGRSGLGGFNCWEPVLMWGKRRIYQDFYYLPPPTSAKPQKDTEEHPCPKPLKLFSWLVEQATDAGHTVLDPFMGSGTTLVAAKQLGRRAVGVEIEERYCEIAAKRLSQEVMPLFDVERPVVTAQPVLAMEVA